LNFVEDAPALAFYQASEEKPIQLGDSTLVVRWAKANPLKDDLEEKIKGGATRNLFIGNLSETANEDTLAQCFHRYGPIESIVILRPKAIAFVNLTSIRSAIAAKAALDNQELAGRRVKVNFAKEKIGVKRPTTQPRKSRTIEHTWGATAPIPVPPFFGGSPFPPPPPQLYPSALSTTTGSRAIFLGNIQDDVTYADLCKLANRYGSIESVKVVKAKNSAFINFIDPMAAAAFVSASQQHPIQLGGQPIRVNWAKSAPLHPELAVQIRQGATRNLFVGNVDDHISEDLIRELFSPFGDFDSVSLLRPKKIAFVNFASLKSALKAREALQGQSVGDPPVQLKINFAKESTPGVRSRTRARQQQQQQQSTGSP